MNENIFNQNRLGILLEYKINDNIKFKTGYLNQTLQLGQKVLNRKLFQQNNGFIFSTVLNFNLNKKNPNLNIWLIAINQMFSYKKLTQNNFFPYNHLTQI